MLRCFLAAYVNSFEMLKLFQNRKMKPAFKHTVHSGYKSRYMYHVVQYALVCV